jgi:hypothetical protein
VDLVGTCPKGFWEEWIAEGDAASDKPGVVYPSITGEEWGWYTRSPVARNIEVGDRFYVVAHGKLRGWAPVTRIGRDAGGGWIICRKGNAVACSIPEVIPGFQGLRERWWPREREIPFLDWREP